MFRLNEKNRARCSMAGWFIKPFAVLLVVVFASTGYCQESTKAPAEVLAAFGLTDGSLIQLDANFEPNKQFVAPIMIDGQEYVFELFNRSIRTENFMLKVPVGDGSYALRQPGPSKTFRGSLRGSKGSRVAGSVTSDGFGGKIVMGDGRVYFVEPVVAMLNDPKFAGSHVIYRSNATMPMDARCGVGAQAEHWEQIRLNNELRRNRQMRVGQGVENFGRGNGGGGNGGGAISICEVAVDADFEFFQSRGSNVQATLDRMEQVLNIVNDQYESQTQITHVISAAIVRDSEPDPYTSSDAGTLLGQVRSEWLSNQGGVPRDVTHMFTGKNLNGGTLGVAFLGTICSNNMGYGLGQSTLSLVCVTDLSAHELGHNWNSNHCNCPNNTMNAGLTCTNNFAQVSINTIVNFRNSRNCLDSADPTNDDFVDTINVGSLPSTDFGSNTGATTEPNESDLDNTGATVWWNAVAVNSGIMTVSTAGSNFDTVLQIYTGNSLDTLSPVASNDDANGTNQSEVSFPVTAGQRYEIRVGGFTNGGGVSQGLVQLTTSFVAEGPTDFFLSDRNIGSGATNTSNADASVTTGSSGSLYLYYDPTNSDIDTGAFFDIQTLTPGVIEFTNAVAFDFDITVSDTPFAVRWGDAFGETGTVTADFIDEWGAFTVVEGEGMLVQNTGPTFFDEGYDASAGAFLFGRIDYNVIGPAGSTVDIVATVGGTGVVHMGNALDVGVGSLTLSVDDPLPPTTDFFWSFADTGASNDSMPTASFGEGASGSMYLYFDPMISDVDTGAFFDLSTSQPGVIEFTNAVSFDFDITTGGVPFDVRWGDAFGEVGTVTPNFIDEWGAFTVVEGAGMVAQNTGPVFFDEGYDASAGAFLFGRVDFDIVGADGDSVDIFTDAGDTGIVHQGMPLDVSLGMATINVGGGLLGDVNCDGSVDLLDVQPFVDLLTNGEFSPKADINGDGVVTLLDVNPFVELLSGG